MKDFTRRAGAGHSSLRLPTRKIALAVTFLALAAPGALAQEKDAGRDAERDEVVRRFGPQAPAVRAVENLGGTVEYEEDGPVNRLVGLNLSGTKVTDADLAQLKCLLKYDLQLISWGDSSGVATPGKGLVIVGSDSNGLLHIRTVELASDFTDTYEKMKSGTLHLVSARASGDVLSDTPESDLHAIRADAIADLKRQLPGWLPPHVLNADERDEVLCHVTWITGRTRLLEFVPVLESLDLSKTGITDAGLVHLRNLTDLAHLKLAQTRVTDAGVTSLLRSLPHLEVSRRPRDLKYFPDGLLDPEGDDILTDCYSEDLFAMKEPPLWALSREDRQAVAYRFLWLPSFHPPLTVRVVPSGEGAMLHAVRLDAVGGRRGGKPVSRRSVRLSHDQWAELRRRVNEARFWTLPTDLSNDEVVDGAIYVVEGVEGGKYHVVSAANPTMDDRGRRYMALCEEMVKLSGLDVMRLWREYREE